MRSRFSLLSTHGRLIGLATAALLWGWTLAVPAAQGPSARSLLQHIGVVSEPDRVTLSLGFSAPVAPHVLRLRAPERLVIDLPATRRHVALPVPPRGALITAIRSGVPRPHQLRLVLQLAEPGLALRWLSARHGSQLRLQLLELSPVAASSAAAVPPLLAATRAAAVASARGIAVAHAPADQREVIIAVDAGHGGTDPGATGPDGTHEKDVTLAIARELAGRIDRTPGMRAFLTRNGDYFVPLRDRMERSRAAHADLFVSIHADSVRDAQISGASVYILSERGASSEAARELANEENAADLKGGISLAAQPPELRSVLMDLSQNASIGQSGQAAQDVLSALDGVSAVRKREVQHAAFVVLKSPDVPSMLIETAYISNPTDERRLSNPGQQQRLAAAILRGIDAYFHQYPPQGSLFARAHAVASSHANTHSSG